MDSNPSPWFEIWVRIGVRIGYDEVTAQGTHTWALSHRRPLSWPASGHSTQLRPVLPTCHRMAADAVEMLHCRGHSGKVRSISWSPDDTRCCLARRRAHPIRIFAVNLDSDTSETDRNSPIDKAECKFLSCECWFLPALNAAKCCSDTRAVVSQDHIVGRGRRGVRVARVDHAPGAGERAQGPLVLSAAASLMSRSLSRAAQSHAKSTGRRAVGSRIYTQDGGLACSCQGHADALHQCQCRRTRGLQGCNYACAITTVDGASIFAAGSDRKLKHMQARSILP